MSNYLYRLQYYTLISAQNIPRAPYTKLQINVRCALIYILLLLEFIFINPIKTNHASSNKF